LTPFTEAIEDGVNGRIVAPNDAGALATAILKSLEPATIKEFSRNVAKTKEKFSWESMVRLF
jgi:glycosyltransferase involved in cell wall biosynthesis